MDVLLQVGKDGELQNSGVDYEIVKFVCKRARIQFIWSAVSDDDGRVF